MQDADLPQSERVLIRTKLNRPELPETTVVRPRLIDRLDKAVDSRVTLISAPAGYGKTTLAVQWLEQRAGKTVWLSLDPADSDPERFSHYLVAAIRELLPGSLTRTAALLEAVSTPPRSYFAETLLSELSELGELGEPLVFVLDDYHTIASEVIHELMTGLVEHLPETLHLLVLSRTDPSLPLARWRGRGWLVDVRQQDLRFSVEEVSAFFDATQPLGLREGDLASLAEKTEGWAAGLQLAQISLAGAPDPCQSARKLSGSDRLISDYLMAEVLANQPPEVRQLLAVTAPLERFCAPLCSSLLEVDESLDAAEILRRMERVNLFLVPLDSRHHWFRYHHLFRELLQVYLPEAASPDRRREVRLRAAEWFAEEELVEEALKIWVDAGHLDRASELLGGQLDTVLDDDHALPILKRWLAIFPPGSERDRLPLLLAHIYLLYMRMDVPGVVSLVGRTEGLAVGDFGPVLDAVRTWCCYWLRDPEGAIRHGDRALEELKERRWSWARSLAGAFRAAGLYQSGRKTEALQYLDEETAREELYGGPHLGRLLQTPPWVHLYAADLEAARIAAHRVLDTHSVKPLPEVWPIHSKYVLAAVALERDIVDEATELLQPVILRRYVIIARFCLDAAIVLARLAKRRSDAKAFDHWSDFARAWAFESGDKESIRIVESFEREFREPLGTPTPVGSPPSPESDALSVWFEVPSVTYAERLLRHPDDRIRKRALPYLEQVLASARACNNLRLAMRYSVLRAEALADAGDWEGALEELGRTLDHAEPHGMLRPFFGGGPRRRELLEALAERRSRREFIDRVLQADTAGGRPGTAGQAAVAQTVKRAPAAGPLTLRELEVLELLAERLTNKEIAANLDLSPEAVKKRLSRMFEKLDVNDRREAVAVAKSRGFLDSSTR